MKELIESFLYAVLAALVVLLSWAAYYVAYNFVWYLWK